MGSATKPGEDARGNELHLVLRELRCENEKLALTTLRATLDKIPKDEMASKLGAKEPQNGCTPLHLLCANANVTRAMIETMTGLHPAAAVQRDRNGSSPLLTLCQNAHATRETIEALAARCPPGKTDNEIPMPARF